MNAKCHKSMPKFNFAGRFPLFVQDASHYCTNKYHIQKFKNRDFTTKLEVIYDENARKRREGCVET
jgi:hypothetical protein